VYSRQALFASYLSHAQTDPYNRFQDAQEKAAKERLRGKTPHAPEGSRPDASTTRERGEHHSTSGLLLRERARLPTRPGTPRPGRCPEREHRRAPRSEDPETRTKRHEPGNAETLEEVPAVRNTSREGPTSRHPANQLAVGFEPERAIGRVNQLFLEAQQ